MNQQTTKTEESRRSFLMKLSLTIGAFAALAASLPVLSALLAPLLGKKEQYWRSVGALKDFQIGSVNLVTFTNPDPKAFAGVTANSAAWLRRNSKDQFIAFAVNCSHLGCPVRWEENAQLFMCPCHGGVYYRDGTVASGPPPRPLSQYEVRILKDQVQIKTGAIPITNLTASRS
jgi:menaquinol-cytochrome c reductase iron-sulfur subunit